MTPWRAALDRLSAPADVYDLPLISNNARVGLGRPLNRTQNRPGFRRYLRLTTPRRALCVALLALALLALTVLAAAPPSFADVRELERRLPQHDLALPSPEGAHGRYVFFADQWTGLGLNNILQESLMLSHLAHRARRAYVFHDYTWSTTPAPFVPDIDLDAHALALRPARIPLNAFISGPTAGGPMPAPRAVSRAFWEEVCPEARRTLFAEVPPEDLGDTERMAWWVAKLEEREEGCLLVRFNGRRPFGFDFFSTSRFLALYPSLQSSPILAAFAWSPLVLAALASNAHLLPPPTASGVLPGVLAVHLRRGDYAEHCTYLAAQGLGYMGMNQHPALPDRFDPPSPSDGDGDADARYAPHCLPTLPQVVARLHAVRAAHPALRHVYLMTNGARAWSDALRRALRDAGGWARVLSGRDLALPGAAAHVAAAVDMAIAERAEVFVGNGFSSLSANVAMLRLARGGDAAAANVRFL
ncbi:hypothetical protein OF83DRAFT_1179473 [Amylostereum chailletii]|nr:hypothetical protein OF83DRAFT_1179473 [Amylostereum chailletii]